jgi:uncharacterized protein YodC (DUF2158 family)
VKPGDVVRCALPGLPMTVSKIGDDGRVSCVWFVGDDLRVNWFYPWDLEVLS